MNDRDRLAADLCPTLDTHTHTIVDGTRHGYCMTAATTLIALGWTRLDNSYDPLTNDEMAEIGDTPLLVHLYEAERIVAALVRRNTLDEERLARALMRAADDNDWFIDQIGWMHGSPTDRSRMEVAAAIAKAYRDE